MIPLAQSNETGQDSEPNLSVNPANTQQLAGSAFTLNPTGATATAPIYVSTNGGTTWTLNNIVPSGNGMTGDITLRFGGSSRLYGATLRGGAGLTMNILRTTNFTSTTAMSLLVTRTFIDQPWVQAMAFSSLDRVYVGNNDFNNPQMTATVDRSVNTAATWNVLPIETRPTCRQDGPPIRTTIHADGTVYGIFYRWRPPAPCNTAVPIPADLVVVRDDNG